jgi:drug/metabolite transporter (DMT)-like permease
VNGGRGYDERGQDQAPAEEPWTDDESWAPDEPSGGYERSVGEERWDQSRSDRPGGARPNLIAIVLGLAIVAAAVFLAYSAAARDVPMMTSAAVVLGLILLAVAISGAVSILQSGSEGRTGRAFLMAIVGGLAGLLAFGCFAIAVLLALVYRLQG